MSVLSWADTHICAAHKGDDGVMHGHTWRVRAFWQYDERPIQHRKRFLERTCWTMDHTALPDNLRRAEDIAAHIGGLVAAVRVDVWRDPEGMGATWTA